MKYDYSFSVWPHHEGWERPIYALFRRMGRRIEMTFTEGEWSSFRDCVERHGLTLRTVERIPHHDPEPVL